MSSRAVIVGSIWQRIRLIGEGINLLQNVVKPLRADVLLTLTYRVDDGCNTTETCQLEERMAGLWPAITRLALEPMPTITELVRTLESLPWWPTLLRAFNMTRHVRPHPVIQVKGRPGWYQDHWR
jgi:hypothetical protein